MGTLNVGSGLPHASNVSGLDWARAMYYRDFHRDSGSTWRYLVSNVEQTTNTRKAMMIAFRAPLRNGEQS